MGNILILIYAYLAVSEQMKIFFWLMLGEQVKHLSLQSLLFGVYGVPLLVIYMIWRAINK